MPLISSLNAEKMLWDAKIRALSKPHGPTSMHANDKDWSFNEFIIFLCLAPGGSIISIAQWLKFAPSTHLAWVPVLTYVDWICCFIVLSLPSRDFSPDTTVFPYPQKQHFFPNSSLIRNVTDKERLFFICECITTKSLFICLSILFAYFNSIIYSTVLKRFN